MLSLKTISTNTLLQAQFHGLEYCWSAQVPDSELKTLATKFVNLHGINPNTRSFTGLFRHGLIYALANPPTNLKFLDVIIPFVQRASIADLKHLARIFQQFGTRCLDSVEPEDRVEEEWESIHTFTEVINKKFQAEVLSQNGDTYGDTIFALCSRHRFGLLTLIISLHSFALLFFFLCLFQSSSPAL